MGSLPGVPNAASGTAGPFPHWKPTRSGLGEPGALSRSAAPPAIIGVVQVAAGAAGCVQVSAVPLQTSAVQRLPSSAHGVPAGSTVQVDEQQDAAVPLRGPSSHCSPGSSTPLPHTGSVVVVVLVVAEVVGVGMPPGSVVTAVGGTKAAPDRSSAETYWMQLALVVQGLPVPRATGRVGSACTVPCTATVPPSRRLNPPGPTEERTTAWSTLRAVQPIRLTSPPVSVSSVTRAAPVVFTVGAWIVIIPSPPVAVTAAFWLKVPVAVPSNSPPASCVAGPWTSAAPVTSTSGPPVRQIMPPEPTSC